MTFKPGTLVVDKEGDRGRVRPTNRTASGQVMVEWETLNGVPVSMQASWEDVADLEAAPT